MGLGYNPLVGPKRISLFSHDVFILWHYLPEVTLSLHHHLCAICSSNARQNYRVRRHKAIPFQTLVVESSRHMHDIPSVVQPCEFVENLCQTPCPLPDTLSSSANTLTSLPLCRAPIVSVVRSQIRCDTRLVRHLDHQYWKRT